MPGYLLSFTTSGNLVALEFRDNVEFAEQAKKLKETGFRSVESVLKETMTQVNLSVVESALSSALLPTSKIDPVDLYRTQDWVCPVHGSKNIKPSKSGGLFCACRTGDGFCKEKSPKKK